MDAGLVAADGYAELTKQFAGCTFENGLYRVHDSASGRAAHEAFRDGFPRYVGRALPFGFDWLGRQFALDQERIQDGEPLVLMLDPGTGETLEIPATFVDFHDGELVDYPDAALAKPFFEAWSVQNHSDLLPLAFTQCVGYRVPLFLGGRDVVSNLEVTDLDVYWSLCGQLRGQTARMPMGTPIKHVSGTE